MTTNKSLAPLTDAELLIEVKRLAASEREATADLIRSLAEVKARGLHLAMGYSSMFGYCTEVLRLSEHAAYARIAAAKSGDAVSAGDGLARRRRDHADDGHAAGAIPHRGEPRRGARVRSAQSKAEVEMIVASVHPRPDLPSSVRKLPAPKPQPVAVPLLSSEVTESIAVPQATQAERPTTPRPQPACPILSTGPWSELSRPSATSCK